MNRVAVQEPRPVSNEAIAEDPTVLLQLSPLLSHEHSMGTDEAAASAGVLLAQSLGLTPTETMLATSSAAASGHSSAQPSRAGTLNDNYTPPRKSYSVQFKQQVIDYAAENNAHAAAKHFKLHVSMVYRWIEKKNEFTELGPDSKRTGSPGRRVVYPEEEERLADWIREKQAQRVIPTNEDIQDKMLELIVHGGKEPGRFKASSGWVRGFFQRKGLQVKPQQRTHRRHSRSSVGKTVKANAAAGSANGNGIHGQQQEQGLQEVARALEQYQSGEEQPDEDFLAGFE